MACSYCTYMQSISLPDHATEVYMVALHECGDDSSYVFNAEFAQWVKERLPEDHSFVTTWCQVRHVRIEHLRYHQERGDTCAVHDQIKARMGDKYEELMAKFNGAEAAKN